MRVIVNEKIMTISSSFIEGPPIILFFILYLIISFDFVDTHGKKPAAP
jgi:hypothetical protein